MIKVQDKNKKLAHFLFRECAFFFIYTKITDIIDIGGEL